MSNQNLNEEMIEIENLEVRTQNFFSVSALGMCLAPIENWERFYQGVNMEFAPVIDKGDGRQFLRAIGFSPLINLAVGKCEGYLNIMLYGLDDRIIRNSMEVICEEMSIERLPLEDMFKNGIMSDLQGYILPHYYGAEAFSNENNLPIQKVYRAFCFEDFLIYNRGYNSVDARKEAFRKFKLPLEEKIPELKIL